MAKRTRSYEGSPADMRQDKKGAKKLGMSLGKYESSARDRKEDAAGQKALRPSNMGRPNQRTMFGKGKR